MPERPLHEQFDAVLDAMLTRRAVDDGDPELAPLLDIAAELQSMPSVSFKARLKSELERKAIMATATETVSAVKQTAAPILRIRNGAAAIEFYKKAFDAREIFRFEIGGTIPHAEIAIGNSILYLGESAPDWGYPGPEFYGGSPVTMHLASEDVDAAVAKAIAAGATLSRPVKDEFYGDRTGSVLDPFGYTWTISTRKEEISLEEMHRRLREMDAGRQRSEAPVPEGQRTVTPYLVAKNAPELIDFVKHTFSGEELNRAVGSAGGIHCEMRIGDTILMLGGGGPDLAYKGDTNPNALHVFVEDADAVYQRAIEAGAESITPPADRDYGERSASVKDAAGNHWYIATGKGAHYIPKGLHAVNICVHPRRGEPMIRFLERGFGAKELNRYASPDGVIHHAEIQLGDSVIEVGDAHGPYQPMQSMFYVHVQDADQSYHRLLQAGATSISEPASLPYGARVAAVKDNFGNTWYVAMPLKSA